MDIIFYILITGGLVINGGELDASLGFHQQSPSEYRAGKIQLSSFLIKKNRFRLYTGIIYDDISNGYDIEEESHYDYIMGQENKNSTKRYITDKASYEDYFFIGLKYEFDGLLK